MTCIIRAITDDIYTDWMIPDGYQRQGDLACAISTMTLRQFEYYGHWELLQVEDLNGRILARKHRWGDIEIWCREARAWVSLNQEADHE